ncbi:eukaryotic translation initiation factor 2C, 3 [Chytriomyces hyalinus]|nr:eukaryotic translation initiation factor 2C, 3 [Chytriomyces hyalinus]
MASAPITLLARRVGKNVPKPEIEAVFSRYGPILEVQLTPGRSANLAVVKFARKKDAEQAVRGCNGVHWSDGSLIVVELDLAEDEDQDSGSANVPPPPPPPSRQTQPYSNEPQISRGNDRNNTSSGYPQQPRQTPNERYSPYDIQPRKNFSIQERQDSTGSGSGREPSRYSSSREETRGAGRYSSQRERSPPRQEWSSQGRDRPRQEDPYIKPESISRAPNTQPPQNMDWTSSAGIAGQAMVLSRARAGRPGYGTKGQAIRIWANSYALSFDIPSRDFYQYDISVKPDTIRAVRRRVIEQWAKETQNVAETDAESILWSVRELDIPVAGAEFSVVLAEGDARRKPQKFTIKIRFTNMLSMGDLHKFVNNQGPTEVPRASLTLLQLILAHRPKMIYTSFHKSTHWGFYDAYKTTFINGGLILGAGHQQSVKYTLGEILLTIDVSNTAFYPQGPLMDLVALVFNKKRIQDVDRRSLQPGSTEMTRLSRFLKNVSVTASHMKRNYKIRGISDKSSTTFRFMSREQGVGMVTVQKYFSTNYNINLRYPDLPCVICSEDGQIVLPMELLDVKVGQRYQGKLSDIQTADIIKLTAVKPDIRLRKIQDGRLELHDCGGSEPPTSELVKPWGLNISKEMKMVDAHVLSAPVVTGGRNSTITPRDGDLDYLYAHNFKFFHGIPLEAWSIAVFGNDRNIKMKSVEDLFSKQLPMECQKRGNAITARRFKDVLIFQDHNPVEATLVEANRVALAEADKDPSSAKYGCAQLIFCIYERKGNIYDQVKHLSETKLGLMTQGLLATKLFKGPFVVKGVPTNLALKVNAKIGGINTTVDGRYLNKLSQWGTIPTMILGADLSHPPAGAKEGLSVAAVVASMDRAFVTYRALERIQGGRVDSITDLKGMVIEHIKQFHAVNGCLPRRFILYRDGVSEGQLQEVGLQEVGGLRSALRELGIPDAKITFVIVSKRHSHRFFAADRRDADFKNGNLKPGTVIDKGVTHPFEFDFYLYSHAGIQGTSRPIHYHVLVDENQFSADEFQEITYSMCYTYARATKSVSLTPAVYYAHLAADRARYHRPCGVNGSESGTGGSNVGGSSAEAAAIAEFHAVMDSIKAKMYYI